MDYSAASDFEINILMNNAITGKDHHFTSGAFDIETGSPCCICCPHSVVLKDYCNSWADMGPIIDDQGIGLEPGFNSEYEAYSVSSWEYNEENFNKGFWWTHNNPLRAACIVFLKMKESSND